jgi:Zn-dependent protease
VDESTRAYLLNIILMAPVVFFSLVIHEFMHAWVATKCGDDTPRLAGRVTLNPFAHLDILGTICLFLGPIGWAKPVPVNPLNFNKPRRDDILVSGAGVVANFTLAVILAVFLRIDSIFHLVPDGTVAGVIYYMIVMGMIINFSLFVFNLVPIPPLDGSHILERLLPTPAARAFRELQPFGIFLLLGLVLLNRFIHVDFLGFRVSLLQVPQVLLVLVFGGPDVTGAIYNL